MEKQFKIPCSWLFYLKRKNIPRSYMHDGPISLLLNTKTNINNKTKPLHRDPTATNYNISPKFPPKAKKTYSPHQPHGRLAKSFCIEETWRLSNRDGTSNNLFKKTALHVRKYDLCATCNWLKIMPVFITR